MPQGQQPDALVFADDRPTSTSDDLYQWAVDAEDLIRAQHARIAELEAQLDAIGAGGVEPLRKQAAPQAVQADVPDGWKLVPVNPTAEMCKASNLSSTNRQRWADMLAAAPAHPAEGVPEQTAPGMTAERASYFMRRFLKEEKLLGPNEQAAMHYVISLLAATQPVAQGMDRQKIDPLRQMLAQHEAHLEQNPYAYFELAYTRRTGWMVWITDKPAFRESVLVNPDRKVLWQGQGDTPDEACENAALAAQAKQGGAA